MKKFTLGARDQSAPNHFRIIAPGTHFLDRATILVLGGNQTIQDEQANGNVKIIEQCLPKSDTCNINLLSVGYNQELVEMHYGRNIMTDDAKAACDAFYIDHILPLLYADEYRKHFKSRKGIEKTLQSITIVSHCGGCMVANRLLNHLAETLTTEGIVRSQRELDNIMNKIQLVGYAPYEKITQNINAFYIAPPVDTESSFETILRGMEHKKDAEFPPKFMDAYRRNFTSPEPRDIVKEVLSEINAPITIKKGSSVLMIPPHFTHSFSCLSASCRSKHKVDRISGEKIAFILHLFTQNSINAFANRPYGIDKNAVYNIISGDEAGDSGASLV